MQSWLLSWWGGGGANLRILKTRVLELGLSSLDRTWQEGRNYNWPRTESKADVPEKMVLTQAAKVSTRTG